MSTKPEQSDALALGEANTAKARPPADLSGTTVEQYRIIGLLGRGGMGVVYRAEDTRLHRTVAIKVLPGSTADEASQRERFLHEARSAAAVAHPNIVTIYEVVEHENQIFLVMELIEGPTLAAQLARERPTATEAVRLACGIARGLARAHARGIVHRDLKPGNVILADGEPKILDFGLAQRREVDSRVGFVSTEGAIAGTPAYMSPEQARGERVNQASDVFSLGAILYEMIAGRAPFSRASVSETLAAILRDPHPPLRDVAPEAPPQLAAIVDRCLAKEPADRYPSGAELLAALDACATESGPLPAVRTPRRRRIAIVVVAAAAIGIAVVWLASTRTHVVRRRVASDPPKVHAITDWPAPRTASADAAQLYAEALQAYREAAPAGRSAICDERSCSIRTLPLPG